MKKTLILLPLIIFTIFITLISVQFFSKYLLSQPKLKIAVGFPKSPLSALMIVAKINGYFQDQDIDVVLKPYPTGKLALKGLFNKEVELAVASDASIVVESFSRNDFSIIATVADSYNQAWIIARKDAGINSVADLKGKRIGTQKESGPHFFLSVFLLHNKITEDQVKILFYPPTDLPKALVNGKIDAFSMRNPFIQVAKNALTDNYIEFIDNTVYLQKFILVGSNIFLEKKKGISSFMLALIKADKFILNNKDESKKIVAEYLGVTVPEIEKDWDNTLCSINLSHDLILILEAQASWLKRNFYINVRSPNYLDFIYKSPELMKHPDKYRIIK